MFRRWLVTSLLFAVAASACGWAGPGGPSPAPTGRFPEAVLVLRLLDSLPGPLDYCDPDLYPIPRGAPLQSARSRLPEIRAHVAIYRDIVEYRHITEPLSAREILTLSDDYKHILAVRPTPVGDRFRFDVLVRPPGRASDERIIGTIGRAGDVHVDRLLGNQARPACPICLARGTRIGAPHGAVRIEDMRVGMVVWSTDRRGHRIPAVVLRVGRTSVPSAHMMVRLVLGNGRSVLVSPGHPAADGMPVEELRPGEAFEATTVVSVERVPYSGGFTYDLLPSGPTHTYFANGILLGSTLAVPEAATRPEGPPPAWSGRRFARGGRLWRWPG